MKLLGRVLLAAAVLHSRSATADGELGISGDLDLSQIEDVEQLSLEDLLDRPVTAASGFSQKPSDSPTIVSTIDAEEISRFGYRTLGDALRGMRGIYTGNDRNYSYIGARGFSVPGDYNTRFALSVDNHLVNDPTFMTASTGLELGLPMIAVDRVELVRGGSWVVHGSNALLGAIQVTTATGASRPGLHVQSTTRFSAESFRDPADRRSIASRGEDVSASYGAVKGDLDVFVAGAYTYDPGLSRIYFPEFDGAMEQCVDGRRLVMASCTGVVTGGDTEEVGNGYASLGYKGWTLHLLASRRDKRIPTASFGTRIGDNVATTDARYWGDLQYRTSTEHFDVLARIAAEYYVYRGQYNFALDPLVNDGAQYYENLDSATAPILAGEVRTRYRAGEVGDHLSDVELGVGSEAHTATAHQWAKDDLPEGPSVVLDRRDPHQIVSVFGHVAGRAFDRVVGFAALRADYYPQDDVSSLDPQVGLVLDGGDHGRVRASWSRGHRAPGLYERYYSTAYGNPPNDLDPERSDAEEISFERYLGDHVRLLVVGFHQDVRGLINLTEAADSTGVYENRGSVRSLGIEAELEGRWDALHWRSSYAFAHARDEDGMRPANSPRSLASLLLLAPVAKGRAEVGVQSIYVGERSSYDGTMLPPLFTTNFVFTVKNVIQQLDLTTGVSNVFDERGGDPGSEEHRVSSIPHDPRTVWIRLGVGLGQ